MSSSLIMVDLNKYILKKDGTIDNNLVMSALNTMNTIKRDEYIIAMKGIVIFNDLITDTLKDINIANGSIIDELTKNATIRKQSVGALSSFSNIGSSINDGCSAVNNFTKSIDPTNYNSLGSYIHAMANFLLCPEAGLMGLIGGVFGSLSSGINNFNPKNILQGALSDLTSFLTGVPGVNHLMNFVASVSSYVSSVTANVRDFIKEAISLDVNVKDYVLSKLAALGGGIMGLINSIKEILAMFGKDLSYILDIPQLAPVKDFLDPDSDYNKSDAWLNGYGPSKLPFPEEKEPIRCSTLAKIIAQLNDSYRTNYRYDYAILDNRYVSGISDPNLKNIISGYLDYPNRSYQASLSKDVLNKYGFKGKTALNTGLATILENNSRLLENRSLYNNMNDSNRQDNAARILYNSQYMHDLNTYELHRQYSSKDGLQMIINRSSFMNLQGNLI